MNARAILTVITGFVLMTTVAAQTPAPDEANQSTSAPSTTQNSEPSNKATNRRLDPESRRVRLVKCRAQAKAKKFGIHFMKLQRFINQCMRSGA